MISTLGMKILREVIISNQPVSTSDLSVQLDCAINTIRKEVLYINDVIREYGIEIGSKSSIGLYVEILDNSTGKEYLESLKKKFDRFERMHAKYNTNTYFLVRYLLAKNGKVSITDLCDLLYCSRSKIAKELNLVKDELKMFHLQLVNKRKDGYLYIEGREFDIRQCMIYNHKIKTVYPVTSDSDDSAFLAYFAQNDPYNNQQKNLRVVFDCLSNQSDIDFPVMDYPKLVHFMDLSYSRSTYSEDMAFDLADYSFIYKSKEYELAKKMFDKFLFPSQFVCNENDIIGLTILLLGYQSSSNSVPQSLQKHYQSEADYYINSLVKRFPFVRDSITDSLIMELTQYLYVLDIKSRFGIISDFEKGGIVESKGVSAVDFCLYFVRDYEIRNKISLTKGDVFDAYYLFHHSFNLHNGNVYYSKNALVISRYGISVAKSIAKKVGESYSRFFGKITAIELNEINKYYESDYDVVITDMPNDMGLYLPNNKFMIINSEFNPGEYKNEPIDHYFVEVRHSIELEYLNSSKVVRTRCGDIESLFECVSEKLENDRFDKKRIYQHLINNYKHYNPAKENGVVLLPVLLDLSDDSKMYLVINEDNIDSYGDSYNLFLLYSRGSDELSNLIVDDVVSDMIKLNRLSQIEIVRDDKAIERVLSK